MLNIERDTIMQLNNVMHVLESYDCIALRINVLIIKKTKRN